METWKILILSILGAVVLGCIVGIVLGKYAIKRKYRQPRPSLLNKKERVIYFASIVLGLVCIAAGIFINLSSNKPGNMEMDMMEQGDFVAQGGGGPVAAPRFSGGGGGYVVAVG